MTAKMVLFHVPQDQELLAAFGEVALRHEHMNHILKMTIKSLAGVTPAEALAATKYEGSGQLWGEMVSGTVSCESFPGMAFIEPGNCS